VARSAPFDFANQAASRRLEDPYDVEDQPRARQNVAAARCTANCRPSWGLSNEGGAPPQCTRESLMWRVPCEEQHAYSIQTSMRNATAMELPFGLNESSFACLIVTGVEPATRSETGDGWSGRQPLGSIQMSTARLPSLAARVFDGFEPFINREVLRGGVPLIAAAAALLSANCPFADSYQHLQYAPQTFGIGAWMMQQLNCWINKGRDRRDALLGAASPNHVHAWHRLLLEHPSSMCNRAAVRSAV
jgi:hypothetical protein